MNWSPARPGLKVANDLACHPCHPGMSAKPAAARAICREPADRLRADTDVFTTFEGDNHRLTQLVAKELLTAYADDIKGMSPVEWVRFAANFAGERVLKRTPAARPSCRPCSDTRQDNEEEGSLFNRGTQVKMFEDREYLIASVARRLQGKAKEMSAFDAFNAVQDHVLHAAEGAHRPDRAGGVRRRHRRLRRRGCSRDPRHGVRPVRAERHRGRQGLVHRAPVPVDRAGQGRHPHQRPMPAVAAARRTAGRRVRHSRAVPVRRDAAEHLPS